MSLMLFYMANSFHLARTPKLRLAHLKRLPPIRQGGRFPPFKSSTAFCALAPAPLCAAADLTGGRINVGVHELLSRDEDLGPQPNRPNEVLK